MVRLILVTALAALGLLGLTVVQLAHDDDPKLLDRQPPYEGPAWRAGDPEPQPLGVEFPSDNVQLLSWLPLSEFGSPSAGNDCWGYTSPSGREYAIFGHFDGTAFVEVTEPTNAQIVANLSGPGSLWRDIKVYQDFAYAVSEGGNGIQVFDLSNIDNGQVSFVRQVGSGSTHNVAIDTRSGFLYRTGGGDNGLRIYNLAANPANPPFVTSWSDRYVHDAEVVTFVSGPHAGRQIAFCASGFNGGHTDTGITVLDVTVKSQITVLSQVSYSGREYSHQLWVDEEQLYLYQGDELDEGVTVPTTTTRIFDISNLSNVTFAGSFTNGSSAIDHNMYIVGDTLYQANYRSGLRVWDITNRTSPVEIAHFDTYPDNDSPSFNGLWSCYPFFASGTVIGSDLERGLFVWRVGEPAIELRLPNGAPPLLDPAGDMVDVEIIERDGTLVPGTAKLHYDDGGGLVTVDLVPVGGQLFEAPFDPTTCEDTIQWYVSAQGSDGITRFLPSAAPVETFVATSGAAFDVAFEDDMEVHRGWVVGAPGDDASTGVWIRVDPIGTAAQPEDDHTDPGGIRCFVTGQGPIGGGIGDNDVDGGKTTLLTPILDLEGKPDARISYWRWYSNDQGANPETDVFLIEISDDNGSSWTRVETIGPTGPESSGGWFFHEFRVGDFVTPTASVKMRFIAQDLGGGSIVEAAIDDFRVATLICEDCNDNGVEDSEDIGSGTSEDCNQNGVPDECDIADGTSNDSNGNGIPDECESSILDCGNGQINASCGSTSDVLFVNGSGGGSDRTLVVDPTTPLTFTLQEAPFMRGDGRTSKAIVYLWLAVPGESDVVQLPKQLGPMCFGPRIVETLTPEFIWNAIGLPAKAGVHNAPTPPPIIPDGGSLDFYDLPSGFGEPAQFTIQGFVPDQCTQGTKPFSVTNGMVVEVR